MKFLTSFSLCYDCNDDILKILTRNCKTTLRQDLGKTHIFVYTRGMIVLYLCAQLALLYTYNCFLILIYYRLGQGCNARKVISEVYAFVYFSVLSLGGNVNTRRMLQPDMGSIFHIKKINEIFWSCIGNYYVNYQNYQI